VFYTSHLILLGGDMKEGLGEQEMHTEHWWRNILQSDLYEDESDK
jgi:hypothetical protein